MRLSLAVKSVIVLLLTIPPSWAGNPASTNNERCDLDPAFAAADIESLTAAFDHATNTISVEMRLCAQPLHDDKDVRYRVYLDYRPPFSADGDDDSCKESSDKMMMWHRNKAVGPGTILLDSENKTLKFVVNLAELNLPQETSSVYVYSETHMSAGWFAGTADRAPNTDVTDLDQCPLPQTIDEVLDLSLSDSSLSCPCWQDLSESGLIAFLEEIPPDPVETPDFGCFSVPEAAQALYTDQDGLPTVQALAFVSDSGSMCDLRTVSETSGFHVTTMTISSEQASKCVEELSVVIPQVSWCQP